MKTTNDQIQNRGRLDWQLVRWGLILYLASFLIWSRAAERYFRQLNAEGYYFVSLYLDPHPVTSTWIIEFSVRVFYWPLVKLDRFFGRPQPACVPLMDLSDNESKSRAIADERNPFFRSART